MSSPDLLLLVENCPKGAETLVTRCLHILTDKGTVCFSVCEFVSVIGNDLMSQALCFLSTVPPSPELVERVRDLYHKRVPDVRFLIPVINGLEKVHLVLFYDATIQFKRPVFNKMIVLSRMK